MRRLGLHIRIENNLTDCIEKAIRLELTTFQSFFLTTAGEYVDLKNEVDVAHFLKLRQQFGDIFLHGSFWLNLCSSKDYNMRLLKKEIEMAKRLEYTHIVLHSGSAKEFETKIEGIDLLAKRLDKVLKREKNIKIVLENTAHGKRTVGSDLKDFEILQEKLDYQLLYCIDTAHAFCQGYDIKNDPMPFINDVDKYLGLENVVLMHLNESDEGLGSKMDKHGIPSLEGNIGVQALKHFMNLEQFKTLPVILELPPTLREKEEREVLDLFRGE